MPRKVEDLRVQAYIASPTTGDRRDLHPILIQTRGIAEDGTERWAIVDSPNVLTRSLKWVYEVQPSSRTATFLKRTRFTSAQEALDFLDKYLAKH